MPNMRNVVYAIEILVAKFVVQVLAASLNNLERVVLEEQGNRRPKRSLLLLDVLVIVTLIDYATGNR